MVIGVKYKGCFVALRSDGEAARKALVKLSRKLAERETESRENGVFFDNFLLRLLLAKESGKRIRKPGRRG